MLGRRFPGVFRYGDVAGVGYEGEAKQVDILSGGFPCQDLSVAGGRVGLKGKRSGLFFEFARLADLLRPRWIIIENVPGLLSSQKGRDMGTILGTLVDLGYGVAWRVLDAKNFGVPQQRRRVIIVGYLGNPTCAGQVLFEPEGSDRNITAQQRSTCISAQAVIHGTVRCATPTSVTLTTKVRNNLDETYIFHTQDPISNNSYSHAIGAGSSAPAAVAFCENQRGELRESNYFGALTAGGGKPGQGYAAVRQHMRVRRLTPLECERLQGFPDGWTAVLNRRGKLMADGPRYRLIGNSMAVPKFVWALQRLLAVDAEVRVCL